MRRSFHRISPLRTGAGIALCGLLLLPSAARPAAPPPEDGPGAMAISPDGQRVYVANNLLNTIDVIDTTTNQVTTVGLPPADPMDLNGAAVSPDGSRLYLTVAKSGLPPSQPAGTPTPLSPAANTVLVIDTATLQPVARVPVGSLPMAVVASPDGKRVYVANYKGASISVIDTATNQVTTTANVGGWPQGLAVTPDGARLYLANSGNSSFNFPVVNTATMKVIANVGLSVYAAHVSISPDGKRVYATGCCEPSVIVDVIDTATNKKLISVIVPRSPESVAATPDGSRAYITTNGGPQDAVAVLDMATKKITATVPVSFPTDLALTPDGRWLYVVNMTEKTVSVIDTATNQVTAKLPVHHPPAVSGGGR